jgi:tRNA pseudouridine38-40 synthase
MRRCAAAAAAALALLALLLAAVAHSSSTPTRIRYVARVSYDGSGFKGWQEQESGTRTVQGTLSRTFQKRFGMPIRCTGASRTDHGVHAKAQCIHFDLPPEKDIQDVRFFEHSFNRMLPGDIRIYNLTAAPPGNSEQLRDSKLFHSTTSTSGKLYIYRFCTNEFVDPSLRNYCTHFYRTFNMDLFEQSLLQFEGTYDFTAFANSVERTEKRYEGLNLSFNTARTVQSVKLVDEGGGYYAVHFNIVSALYRMVRNMVGASMCVAEGRMSLEKLVWLLQEAPGRTENPSKSAPPQGLWLEHVYYDHY